MIALCSQRSVGSGNGLEDMKGVWKENLMNCCHKTGRKWARKERLGPNWAAAAAGQANTHAHVGTTGPDPVGK